MSAQSNHRNPITINIPLGSLSADGTVCGGAVLRKSKILAAYIQNGAAIAASNTDFAVITLKVGSTIKCTLDTRAAAQNGLADKVAKAMVVNDADLAAGDSLTAVYDETDSGTAIALTGAVLTVVLEQKGSA